MSISTVDLYKVNGMSPFYCSFVCLNGALHMNEAWNLEPTLNPRQMLPKVNEITISSPIVCRNTMFHDVIIYGNIEKFIPCCAF